MYKILAAFTALALVLTCAESAAQSYPSKTIRFVDGSLPGGGTDIVGRIVAQRLAEQLGQPVIVENKPGADSVIGAEYAAKAAPDGYTLFIGSTGAMVHNPGLYAPIRYDPVKDFIPITMFVWGPVVFAVQPSFPANSLKELIALAKAKPGGLFYGSGASPFHVVAEFFKREAGVNIVHVPYKGAPTSITAAIAGEVAMVSVSISPVLEHLRAGNLRALAVSGPKRFAIIPDVPTIAESGLTNVELMVWIGLFAPAGTPSAIIDKLYNELTLVLKAPSVKKRFASLGYDASEMGMPPAEFGAILAADLAKWTKVIQDLNIRAR